MPEPIWVRQTERIPIPLTEVAIWEPEEAMWVQEVQVLPTTEEQERSITTPERQHLQGPIHSLLLHHEVIPCPRRVEIQADSVLLQVEAAEDSVQAE